jgi:hypothetical protein
VSAVTDVTYVSFVPRDKRAKLRQILKEEGAGPLQWREKRRLFGSEFYFSGPSALARETHLQITRWLAGD